MRILSLTTLLAASFLLNACLTGSSLPRLEPFTTQNITFVAEPDANQGQSTRVEVVFALDAATLKQIEGFTAQGWASVQHTLVGDWQDKVIVVERQVMPAERVVIDTFPEGFDKAVGYVIFAHYDSPGLHRRVYLGEPRATIYLHDNHLSSSSGKPFELTRPPEPVSAQRGGY